MSEPSAFAYFDAITAQRALLLSEEEALEGTATVSLETQDAIETDVYSYIEDNIVDFLKVIRFLSNEDQELLLSYYILAKTQTSLAVIHQTTQTICSFLVRKAIERVGMFILLGPPTEEIMANVFKHSGHENVFKKVPMSKVVSLYDKTRSFQQVAQAYSLYRPEVRRQLRKAARELADSDDIKARALGAYVHGLVEKASASGAGLSRSKLMKQGNIIKSDPDILGQFKIQMDDPNFHHVFISRANR